MGWPPAGLPPGSTPGRTGRDPSADRLDHMPPIRSGSGSWAAPAMSVCWRPWIVSNRDSLASIAWARVRSACDVARVAACRNRSRSGGRFHDSLGPVTASDMARSMSASSSPDAAAAPALTAGGGLG